nr:Hpt domain-containing protein [Vallitaleaceae bacterium]
QHINRETGLELLGHSKKLYNKLLTGFAAKYVTVHEEFETLIGQENFEEARRLAHSIKGLCGNLGAEHLGEISKDLEYSFRDLTPEYIRLLPIFENELQVVLSEIDVIIKDLMLEEPEITKTKTEVALETYNMHLEQLYRALIGFKHSEIKKAYEKIKTYNVPTVYTESLHPVFGAIDHFDYKTAANILESQLEN